MTTATPIHFTAEDYPDTPDSEHMEYLVSGLASATQWPEGLEEATRSDDLDAGDHPARLAWDRVCDEAAEEIAPQVADMLTEAVRRRMPWTWGPEL